MRHIRIITETLLHRLMELTSRYDLTPEQQDNIPLASALHDIGQRAALLQVRVSSALLDASLQIIRERLLEANEGYTHSTARTQQLSTEMLLKQATPQVGRSIQALETERIKTEFFAKQSCGIQFDYDTATRTISVTDHTDTLPFASRLYDAADTEKFTIFSKDDLNRLENALSATTRDAPDVSMPITLRFPEVGWEHEYMLAARALWSSDAAAVSRRCRSVPRAADRYHAAGDAAAGFRRCHMADSLRIQCRA